MLTDLSENLLQERPETLDQCKEPENDSSLTVKCIFGTKRENVTRRGLWSEQPLLSRYYVDYDGLN